MSSRIDNHASIVSKVASGLAGGVGGVTGLATLNAYKTRKYEKARAESLTDQEKTNVSKSKR